MKRTYVTVISTDNYLPGVLALERNIREVCSYPLIVMLPQGLNEKTYMELSHRNIPFIFADDIEAPKEMLHATEEHSWFGHWAKTFFKLRIFDLTEYEKIVFVDCDMILLESIDGLFELPHMSATIGGKSYPGNEHFSELNSGILTIVPEEGLSGKIAAFIPEVAKNKSVFGDQDVMQAYFKDWAQNPELIMSEWYNVFFSHYHYYSKKKPVKGVHFIGRKKPWMMNKFDVLREYVRCLIKGNAKGITILRKYRKLLKEVSAL